MQGGRVAAQLFGLKTIERINGGLDRVEDRARADLEEYSGQGLGCRHCAEVPVGPHTWQIESA